MLASSEAATPSHPLESMHAQLLSRLLGLSDSQLQPLQTLLGVQERLRPALPAQSIAAISEETAEISWEEWESLQILRGLLPAQIYALQQALLAWPLAAGSALAAALTPLAEAQALRYLKRPLALIEPQALTPPQQAWLKQIQSLASVQQQQLKAWLEPFPLASEDTALALDDQAITLAEWHFLQIWHQTPSDHQQIFQQCLKLAHTTQAGFSQKNAFCEVQTSPDLTNPLDSLEALAPEIFAPALLKTPTSPDLTNALDFLEALSPEAAAPSLGEGEENERLPEPSEVLVGGLPQELKDEPVAVVPVAREASPPSSSSAADPMALLRELGIDTSEMDEIVPAPVPQAAAPASGDEAQLDLLKELGLDPGVIAASAPTPTSAPSHFGQKFQASWKQWKRRWKPHSERTQKLWHQNMVWMIPVLIFLGFVVVNSFIDLYLLWPEGQAHASLWDLSRNETLHMLGGINRSMNQLLAACMVCLIIALPLTANLYTPRLIVTLTSDRVTVFTILLMVINNANTVWTLHNFNFHTVPVFQTYLCFILFVLSVVMTVPYFVKILGYLDPYFILLLLEREVKAFLADVVEHPQAAEGLRASIMDRLNIINNMVLKAAERADRELAIEGVRVQKRLLDHYAPLKRQLPAGWLEVNYFTFIGMSTLGVEEVNKRKIWLELYFLRFMTEVFSKSLNRLPDVASGIAELVYQIGMKFMNINDHYVMDLCMRIFNTFLSTAVDRKDMVTIHNVFYQYRLFAEMTLSAESQTVCATAENFRFYSHLAAENRLPQVRDTALYDLVHLAYVAKTYANDEEAYAALCEAILAFDIFEYAEESHNIAKAKLIFGGFLISIEDHEMLERLWPQLEAIPLERLTKYRDDLLIYNEKIQPEITDRFVSSAYLSEEQMPLVQEMFERLGVLAREEAL